MDHSCGMVLWIDGTLSIALYFLVTGDCHRDRFSESPIKQVQCDGFWSSTLVDCTRAFWIGSEPDRWSLVDEELLRYRAVDAYGGTRCCESSWRL